MDDHEATSGVADPKRLLFVCIENAGRSQMAEAFARIHGKGTVEAYSAGSRPAGIVNARATESMREIGYDLTAHTSKSLADIPDLEYDVVVTMGCGDACPSLRAKRREEWDIPDPKQMPVRDIRSVRDTVERKVKALLAEISPTQS